jgi:glycosyltransferase involved in cell wall biosynthesis
VIRTALRNVSRFFHGLAEAQTLRGQLAELAARHREIVLRHEEIARRHDEIKILHEEIARRHCEIGGEDAVRLDNAAQAELSRRQAQLAERLLDVAAHHSNSIRWLAERQIATSNPALPKSEPGTGPLVSIIMPVWNRAGSIAAAVRSVLAQTYSSWELLIVDDGSDDETAKVVETFLADGRVRLFRQPHAGHCVARNRGLRESRGAIIAYLDSDVVWFPGNLQAIVAALESHRDRNSAYGACLYDDQRHDFACILAGPLDPERLLNGRMNIDLNMFVHRRVLTERHGGFDERLTRHVDCDLILRYTQDEAPVAAPFLGVYYQSGGADRVSVRENGAHNLYLIRQKFEKRVARPLRVLYALWHYPQLSESYVRWEIACMRRWGVDIEVWAENEGPAPFPSEQRVHRGSLADAIRAVQPHCVHTHWSSHAVALSKAVAAAVLPLTVRSHSFDHHADLIALQNDSTVRRIYVFPHQAEQLASQAKIQPMNVAFNGDLFYPAGHKDSRMVLRAAAAIPGKDLESFFQIAMKCPDYRFVLAVCRCRGRERYVEELLAHNDFLGCPVDLHVNVPAEEMASLVRQTGIYLHTYGFTEPYGMPISIAEAMATGCYVVARHCPASQAYVGSAGQTYTHADHAAAIIQESAAWDEKRWHQVRRTAVDRAFQHFADLNVLRPMLDDWLRIASEQKESMSPEPAPGGRAA